MASFVTLPDMIENFSRSYGGIINLLSTVCVTLGVLYTFRAVYHLKVYGEMRTMMGSQSNLKEPVTHFIVGAVFLYLPTTWRVLLESTFGTTEFTPYSYVSSYDSAMFPQAMTAIYGLIRIVGFVAFIRGWMQLASLSSQGGGQGRTTIGKALTHIFGGFCAINIYGTIEVLKATFT